MRQKPALTVDILPEGIRDFLGSIQCITYPEQGETSRVAFVESSQGSFVIKCAHQQPFRDWLCREAQVLRSLAGKDLPIPGIYHFEEGRSSQGDEAWLLMERLPGEPLQLVLENTNIGRSRQRLLQAFGELLGKIHRCHPPPGLAELDQPWLEVMLRRAREYLQCYLVDGTLELLRQLEQYRPQTISLSLIHGDYTLDNVLVTDGRISGVIDWAGGAVGDPRYDLALATQPMGEVFQSSSDLEPFYEGYGGKPISAEEAGYFLGLYEFF